MKIKKGGGAFVPNPTPPPPSPKKGAKKMEKQECIPVGCVPTAPVAISGGGGTPPEQTPLPWARRPAEQTSTSKTLSSLPRSVNIYLVNAGPQLLDIKQPKFTKSSTPLEK